MADKDSKQAKQKHYNKSNNKFAFIVVLIFLIIIFISMQNHVINIEYKATQIILNNENITSNLEENIVIQNDKIYMSVDDIKKFIDETVYFDNDLQSYITTSDKKLAIFKENGDTITINGSTLSVDNIVIDIEGKKFIAISEMKNIYDYEFNYVSDTNIVIIDYWNKKCETAVLKKNADLKENDSIFSKTIKKLKKGETLICIEENENKTKVKTKDGLIGFIKTKLLENKETIRDNFEEEKTINVEDISYLDYDLNEKDISTFEKRQDIINIILQQAIKNDKMYVKILYNEKENEFFERFKIEAKPILLECGIKILI